MASAPRYQEPPGTEPVPMIELRERGARITDRLGAIAGALCAVHCAATLPMAGLLSTDLGAFLGHDAELFFVGIATLFVVLSSVHGFRHHRSWAILGAFAASLGLWVVGTLFASGGLEAGLHVGAAVGLATTHVVSLRRLHTCRH